MKDAYSIPYIWRCACCGRLIIMPRRPAERFECSVCKWKEGSA